MKKFLLITVVEFIVQFSFAQATTAPNYIGNDCAGDPHNFFNEMDAGKVLVLCWVMPCGACEVPAITAYNITQNYQSSYPNRVFYYLLDDFADNPCSDLDGFAILNNMRDIAMFSDSTIDMSAYGSAGMPTIAVVGGTSHTIFYHVADSVDSIEFQNGITNALYATGITDPMHSLSKIILSPNPANSTSTLSFNLKKSSVVNAEVYNQVGQKIHTMNAGTLSAGENKIQLNTTKLSNGIYFVTVSDTNRGSVLKLVISH